ncbi:MAG: flagellar M-ring protein FliF [Gemmatimonadetes bacterium]|nr:flagellar M-ring protein FliF [Gemmatimonadota bacterium]
MNELLGRIGGSQRILALLVGVGAMAAVWGFARWGKAAAWVPVASGIPLERVSLVTQRLDGEGIPYRLERGGSVVAVEETSAAQARVALAVDGIGTNPGRPGFELFDQPSWGMTDFTQRVNYRRALEGELERTIGHMRGVQSAQVHLALREASFLKNADHPSQASVVLGLAGTLGAEDSVVEGIQFLVASSVEGLAPDQVRVLDDRGRLLSSPDAADGSGQSNRQLQVQRQLEGHLQDKAESLVSQMVGPGNATVRVSAALNFDQIEQRVEAVNPDQQALVSEERSEITPGSAEQGASQVTSSTVYETARSTETTSRGGARIERLTVAVVLTDRRSESEDGSVTWQARTPEETRRVEALVKHAVGFSPERGDEISVVSAPPEVEPSSTAEMGAGPDIGQLLLAWQRPAIALFGLATALFLALRVLGTMRATAAVRTSPAGLLGVPAHGPNALEPHGSDARLSGSRVAGALEAAPAPAIVADPDMTARVVRAWMKD